MADLNSMEFTSGHDYENDKNMMALGVIKRSMTRAERIKARERAQAHTDSVSKTELDTDGKEISPHIPKFIADKPWYVDESSAVLGHQKHAAAGYDRFGMDPSTWYARGQRAGPAATKYRKGACQNCGAMTHNARDCLERPRKLGAKYTGRDIQPDEIIRKFEQSFEGKRVCLFLFDRAN